MTLKIRDRDITIKVLSGSTLENAGKEYGLTTERTRQIMRKTINAVDPILINKTKQSGAGRRKSKTVTDEYRDNSSRLIPLIKNLPTH